jgi:hypothetical protein
MATSMDPLQIRDLDLRVDLRRRDRSVPEEHLDVPEIGPTLEHVGGTAMSENVRGNRFA